MMDQIVATHIFLIIWDTLLIIAVAAHLRYRGKIKQKGGVVSYFLVIAPYLVVFGWFSVRGYVGTYHPHIIPQLLGIVIMITGLSGYIISILYLRRNWTVAAAIKEGHALVKKGPYRFVRHPMYFFMTLVVLGSGLLISSFLIILYTPIVAFLYYLRSKKEEEMLIKALPGYEQYMKESKMLIPGIF